MKKSLLFALSVLSSSYAYGEYRGVALDNEYRGVALDNEYQGVALDNEYRGVAFEDRTDEVDPRAVPIYRGNDGCPPGYQQFDKYCSPTERARYSFKRAGNESCPPGYQQFGKYCQSVR